MVGRGEDKIGEEGVGDKVVGFISHKFVVVCSSWGELSHSVRFFSHA